MHTHRLRALDFPQLGTEPRVSVRAGKGWNRDRIEWVAASVPSDAISVVASMTVSRHGRVNTYRMHLVKRRCTAPPFTLRHSLGYMFAILLEPG